MPAPLRSVLAALFGVDLSANALKVSPRARGANPDPEEGAALVPEAESGKRGKKKEKSSKRKKGGKQLLLLTQADSTLDDADDSEDEPAPRGRPSRPGSTPLLTAQTPPSTGKEPGSSRPARAAAEKSDRDKAERTKSRDKTGAEAPKVKGLVRVRC